MFDEGIQLSDKQKAILILVVSALILFGLWHMGLMWGNRERRKLESKIKTLTASLTRRRLLQDETILKERNDNEKRYSKELLRQWREAEKRLATFGDIDSGVGPNVRHIDFKVELLNVRKRLQQKSRAVDIRLPPDLGVNEDVTSGSDARRLMLQLKAVEKLTDIVLDLPVDVIGDIRPLTPITRISEKGQEAFLEEYPVYMELYCPVKGMYELFEATMKPGQAFVVRHMRVEKYTPHKRDYLKVEVVLSAMVFLKDPAEMRPVKIPRDTKTTAQGH